MRRSHMTEAGSPATRVARIVLVLLVTVFALQLIGYVLFSVGESRPPAQGRGAEVELAP